MSSNSSEEAPSGYPLGDEALRALPRRIFAINLTLEEAFEYYEAP